MYNKYQFIQNIYNLKSSILDLYFDTQINQKVIIKKISRNNCSFEDYISEISAQALVQSEEVIHTHESFNDARNYFTTIEAGTRSLMDIFFHGRLSEKTLKLLINPVFRGLMKLLKSGVIHHDIKPENLVLCKTTGKLKIIDFGLAEICEGDDVCKLRGGTWPCLSPEHLKKENCSSKTDVWSLGIVLFLSLTGVFPFNSKEKEIYHWKVMNESPDFSHLQRLGVSLGVFLLIQYLISKDPNNRHLMKNS
jgi:calcium-dependent protein kinase